MKNLIIIQSIIISAILSASTLNAASAINESFLKKINTDGDETSCAITGDHKFFIFARKPKDKDDSDLFFTEFKNGKWSDVQAMTDLNTDSDEISPFISDDGKFVLFSSNRPGSLKNSEAEKPSYDIYYSERNESGGWEKPELLFGAVNTSDDEINPFITKDGSVLYFTRSPFDDKNKTTIIKVYNRNDSWEDIETAGISKNSDFTGIMYKKSLYKPGSFVTGFKKSEPDTTKVFYTDETENSVTELSSVPGSKKSPVSGISVTELDKNSIIVSSNTKSSAGNFDFSIKKIRMELKKVQKTQKETNELPKNFTLKIESVNYNPAGGIKLKVLFFSSLKKNSMPKKTELKSPDSSGMINIQIDSDIRRVLVLPGETGMKSFAVEFLTEKDVAVSSIIKIEPSNEKEFTPKPVYFKFNSSDIQITDIPYIYDLIDYLRKNEKAMLSLDGFSDGIGSYRANLDISVRRAEIIKDYIVRSGINKDRITTKGSGYIKEKTPETSQYLRRVESVITQK